ncbi:MAG: hypothetical protein JZU52_03980 [Lamprocystis purpurea]|jgi:hypothetical protein|nr:hypothetical protein [Lamprocystis purpurea]
MIMHSRKPGASTLLRIGVILASIALLLVTGLFLSARHPEMRQADPLAGSEGARSLPRSGAPNVAPAPVTAANMSQDLPVTAAETVKSRPVQGETRPGSAETVADFQIAFKHELLSGIRDGFASDSLERLTDEFAAAKLSAAEKQSMLWELRSATPDPDSRMVIYDIIERIGAEAIVGTIVADFGKVASPEEQARILVLLDRSLDVSDSDLVIPAQRAMLEQNTREILDLFKDQLRQLGSDSPVFHRAVQLLPNLASSEDATEIYDGLLKSGTISQDTYFDAMSRVVLSEESVMVQAAPELLSRLARESEPIRSAVNPKIYEGVKVICAGDKPVPEEIKSYIEAQRPAEYSPAAGEYLDWSISYFNWLQAMETIGHAEAATVTNASLPPIERALLVAYRPGNLSDVSEDELLALQNQMRVASRAFPQESPHRGLFDDAVAILEEQIESISESAKGPAPVADEQ